LPANNCQRTVSRSNNPANGRSLHRFKVPSTSRNATLPRYSERTARRTSDTRPRALLVDRCGRGATGTVSALTMIATRPESGLNDGRSWRRFAFYLVEIAVREFA
jgi:hypothetical protein